jgi:hypothetical protein
MESLLSTALWLAGIGHFCLLGVSFQVPARANWKEDLLKLLPLNRKLLWVYGGFTVLTIVAFGALTLLLHREFLQGDRAAVALAAFMAVYWTARILVDVFYLRHSDWPAGDWFVVAHVGLFAFFTALAATYWAVVVHAFAL